MLSRTADNLYWMARYMERAGNLARVLEVADRMALLPQEQEHPNPVGSEWHSALITSGAEPDYFQKYETLNTDQVKHFLLFDGDNPSSIRNCIDTARRNARSVRSSLTAEVWASLNETWLAVWRFDSTQVSGSRLREFLDWTRERSLQFHGAVTGTMLRDDAYSFTRLGTYLERADNTARILDVKYHILLPENSPVGGSRDYYQWASILRAVSAHRSYRHLYREGYRPWLIADLLILREEMPRSLVACLGQIREHLQRLAELYTQQLECSRLAGQQHAHLRYARMEEVFQLGLHEFLTRFIEKTSDLSDQIRRDFLMV